MTGKHAVWFVINEPRLNIVDHRQNTDCACAGRSVLCTNTGHEADYLRYHPVGKDASTPVAAQFSSFVDQQYVISMRGLLAHVLMCRIKSTNLHN